MAHYCHTSMQELDDVHRLLPREILNDIGVIDPTEQQRLAVIEDLAMRLASALGGGAKMTSCCRNPQVNFGRGFGCRDVLSGGGGNVRRAAAPPFLPAPTAPWLGMERSRNDMVLIPAAALPRFARATARPLTGGVQPTIVRRGGGSGTGVFLPRSEAVRRTANNNGAKSPSKGMDTVDVKPMRQNQAQKQRRRRGEQAAMEMIIRKQQEMQAMASQMEQRCLNVHACPEFALPQQWTYY